jgi:hypothetical protein
MIIDILAEQLGRFAFRTGGCARFRHFSKIDEPEPGRELARRVPRAHLQRKEYLDEHGYCEVV